jgi:hypothetical protein
MSESYDGSLLGIVIVVALGKGLLNAVVAKGVLVIRGGNVTVLGILVIVLIIALGKRLIMSAKATVAITATLPHLPLPQLLSWQLLLPLPHFFDCCLPPPLMLLSADAIATVPTVATTAPVLTLTPSLKYPSIVASSIRSSTMSFTTFILCQIILKCMI